MCTCTVCLGRGRLYQSLFDSVLIMDFSNIATCLGMTFLYRGMCKVTPHVGCSSVADVHRYRMAGNFGGKIFWRIAENMSFGGIYFGG